MNSELFEIIIPSTAFFLGFFLAFSLIEMIIVLLLNGFVYKHWSFVADVVLRVKVRHGKLVRLITLVLMAVFILILIRYTSVIQVLMNASLEEKLYAGQILLVIFLTYLIATRRLAKLDFLKQIHRYLYAYLSIITYVFMILLINQQYQPYQEYINARIVVPIQENVETILENRKRKRLLTEFRRQIHNGTCPRVDLSNKMEKGDIEHVVYVTTHPDLSLISKPINTNNPKNYLVGRLCSSEGTDFLLTHYGQWFWIINETENYR